MYDTPCASQVVYDDEKSGMPLVGSAITATSKFFLCLGLLAYCEAATANSSMALCNSFRSGQLMAKTADEFVDAIHLIDGCESHSDCMFPLIRRENDYHLVLSSVDDEHLVGERSQFILSFLRKLDKIIGVKGHYRQEISNVNHLAVIIVPTSISGDELDEFVSNFVALPFVDFRENRAKLFRKWLDSDLLCTSIRTNYPDSKTRDVSIWIKNEISKSEFERCVQQETLKLLGVGRLKNPGLVVDGKYVPSDGPALTERDYFFLKLAYSSEFISGQTHLETRKNLATAVDSVCEG